jgi:hypothetical protein
MNRKVLASLAVIFVLAVALFILTRERGADLPRIEPWSGETEEIVIKRPGEIVRLYREAVPGSSAKRNTPPTRRR